MLVEETFVLNYVNAREVSMQGIASNIKEVITDGRITGLEINDSLIVAENHTIVVGKPANRRKFKVRFIERNALDRETGNFRYTLIYDRINITSILLLPGLCPVDKIDQFKTLMLWHSHLVNAYLHVEGASQDSVDSIFVLYRFDRDSAPYRILEEALMEHPFFKSRVDPDGSHVLFEFGIPDYLKPEVELVLKSKYSELSSNHKQKCIVFHSWTANNRWFKILKNSRELRAELEESLGVVIPNHISLGERLDLDNKETYLSEMIM